MSRRPVFGRLSDAEASPDDPCLALLLTGCGTSEDCSERTAERTAEVAVRGGPQNGSPERTSPDSPPKAMQLGDQLVHAPTEIKCPICLDPFRDPVTLHCNHNVCFSHVLDLAVDDEAYSGVNCPFSVKCPKCRFSTFFPKGEAGIHVNREMKVVVETMLTLLGSSTQAPEAPPTRPERRVRFESDEVPSTATDSVELLSSPPRGQAQIQRAQQQLLALEKRLENQRLKLQQERAETCRLKSLQYKQQRSEEIAMRRQHSSGRMPLQSTEGANVSGSDGISTHTQPIVVAGQARGWNVVEEYFESARKNRDRLREIDLERRERDAREGIALWKRDHSVVAGDTSAVTDHVRRFGEYVEDSRIRCSGLRDHGSDDVPQETQEEERFDYPLDADLPNAQYDEEVERVLWEVDLRIQREREEELTRAKMAELAEARARSLIEAFRAPQRERRLPPPTYTPKAMRLQPL